MEKSKVFFLIMCLLPWIATGQSKKQPVHTSSDLAEPDKQYIQNVTSNVQDNWNKGNREPYVDRFSLDAVCMAPNMETLIGKDAIRSFANSFPELKLNFTLIEINGVSQYAYMRGVYMLTTPTDSLVDKGKFLGIWKKTPQNTWLLTHDMFSSDLPLKK